MAIKTEKVGINYNIDEVTDKYIEKRIGRLDRFLPRQTRKTATAKVTIKQVNKSHGNKYSVDAVLTVPNKVITAKDESSNVLAAIDILEVKLASQISRYKAEVTPHVGKHRFLARIKRLPGKVAKK
ncbi:MAG: ribosome-associated translation inhibitor RaiA [Candidatus Nomurabacteria bacterium]|jgi:putative sigma-54 modulation protein|nr:ribosome-associated translation inhibitor RaiA [Candidatus Nomurabacteria bacterium]